MLREKHKGRKPRGESTDAVAWGGPIRNVRWAAHESWGLKSPRRSDEGRCIQSGGNASLAGRARGYGEV